MTPEAQARQQIDATLTACGWLMQEMKSFNPGAGPGIALREVTLVSVRCDYLVLVNRVSGNQDLMRNIGLDQIRQISSPIRSITEQRHIVAEVKCRPSVIRKVDAVSVVDLHRAPSPNIYSLWPVYQYLKLLIPKNLYV